MRFAQDPCYIGGAENDGHEIAGREIAEQEIAGRENA